MSKLKWIVALAICAILGAVAAAANGTNSPPEKITICHVAGLASDPANYITLHLPPQAVYGNGGHFNENGTPQAGHEQDSFGECDPPEPPVDECPNNPDRTEPPCEEEPPPPVDNCPNNPDRTEPPCEETPPPPPRVCPDGQPPTPGEGAYDPNDDCKRKPPEDPPPPTTTPAPSADPVTPPPVVTPPVTSSTPPVRVKPKAPKPDKPPVIVKVEKRPNGVVKITTSDGKTHTGIMGSG